MAARAIAIAMLALISLGASQVAVAQSTAKPPLNEAELKELLIWNSPWEGRSTTPPGLYSYRHIFRQRRDALVAEVTSLSTNQRSDSVVVIRNGALNWQDSNGADVNVSPSPSGELVGTAKSHDLQVPIILRPRP